MNSRNQAELASRRKKAVLSTFILVGVVLFSILVPVVPGHIMAQCGGRLGPITCYHIGQTLVYGSITFALFRFGFVYFPSASCATFNWNPNGPFGCWA